MQSGGRGVKPGTVAVLALAGWLQGCAGAGLAVMGATAGVGLGTGVEHQLSGISYKTFAAPIGGVHVATRSTLSRLGMPVTADAATETGRALTATATGRTIDIELERLTPQTTRMRVSASQGGLFFKDSATATEIILQTAQSLQNDPSGSPRRVHQRRRDS